MNLRAAAQSRRVALVALVLALGATSLANREDAAIARAAEPEPPRQKIELVPEFPRAAGGPFPFGAQDLSVWQAKVPRIEQVEITSAADGNTQRALFHDPGGNGAKPLLVVLHSWSEGYLQNISIPYGVFAERNGWVLVHPDHRGPYRRPEATASTLALQDVLDAVAYAREHADVDPTRIYLAGYSGSAMTSLVLAAKHPELFAAVVAWVPIYDLVDWYEFVRAQEPPMHYAQDIAASCGGPPVPGSRAAEECRRRSPSAYLRGARGRVHVFLGAGIWDQLVPPDHALRAFNDLAAPEDRVGDEDLLQISRTRRIPGHLGGESGSAPARLFTQARAEALFARTSERATVVVFQGGHDVIYNAGLAWLADKRRN